MWEHGEAVDWERDLCEWSCSRKKAFFRALGVMVRAEHLFVFADRCALASPFIYVLLAPFCVPRRGTIPLMT